MIANPTLRCTMNNDNIFLRDFDVKSSSMSASLADNESMADSESRSAQAIKDLSDREEDVECDIVVDELEIRQHHSYEQVLIDVNRCAGRLASIRQVYLHTTDEEEEEEDDDDDEQPEHLKRAIELQRMAHETGKSLSDLSGGSTEGGELASRENININNQDDDEDDDEVEDYEILELPYQDTYRNYRLARELRNQRKLKVKLVTLIVRLLIKKPELHYYQGFRDVCLTYMTILGERDAFRKLDKLVDSHFSIFMQPTMNETQEFLALIPIIVGLHDKESQIFLEQAEVGTIFALSWVITWFSHVIPNQRDVERIFEFLEENDPHMVLYLSAAIVLYKSDRLKELEPEMSTVHHFLCQVPRKEKLPIEELIDNASDLFSRFPPELVKQKLIAHRNLKLQVQNNTKIVEGKTHTLGPVLTSVISNNSTRRAIVVLAAKDLDDFIESAYHYLDTDCDMQLLVKGTKERVTDRRNSNGTTPPGTSNGIGIINNNHRNQHNQQNPDNCSPRSDTTDTYDLLKDYLIISPTSPSSHFQYSIS